MKRSLKFYLIFAIHTFAFSELSGQHLKVNADKIAELIEQWNSIHNRRADAAFVEVYEGELFYYAERVPQSKATLLKKLLFVRNPEYQQRVSGPVKLEVYKNGIVKCDFTKQVWKNSRWVSNSMYLLIRYGNHGYWIMGESDYETDKRFGFTPKLGAALQSKFVPLKTEGTPIELLAKSDLGGDFVIDELIPSPQIIILLIVALVACGIVVILRNNSAFQNYLSSIPLDDPPIEEEEEEEEIHVTENHHDHEADLIKYRLNQDAFREYLFTLFDPKLFKCEIKNQDHIAESSGTMRNRDNKIHVQFCKNTSQPTGFDIQYFYIDGGLNEMQLCSTDLFARIKEHGAEAELYIVIGMGGSPDDPDDIYLLPAEELKLDSYTKEELQHYKKFGLFFFSQSQHQLC